MNTTNKTNKAAESKSDKLMSAVRTTLNLKAIGIKKRGKRIYKLLVHAWRDTTCCIE